MALHDRAAEMKPSGTAHLRISESSSGGRVRSPPFCEAPRLELLLFFDEMHPDLTYAADVSVEGWSDLHRRINCE